MLHFLSFFICAAFVQHQNVTIACLGQRLRGAEAKQLLIFVLNDAQSYFDIFLNTNVPEHEDQNIHLVCLDSSTALKLLYSLLCFFLKK